MYRREIHTEYKRGHQIRYLELELHTVVNQCGFWMPAGLLEKKGTLLTSKPAIWHTQNLFVMRYGINYYELWLFPCSMQILFLSNWISFLTFLELLILCSIIFQAQKLPSIQILWTAGIPSTESLLTIISMQFCPKGSGLGVGAQRGAREHGLGKGKGPLSL